MIGTILAAEFCARSGKRPAILDINRIVDGHRSNVISFNVANKKEARGLAKQYGATPWNF